MGYDCIAPTTGFQKAGFFWAATYHREIICFIQCNIHIYIYHINKSDVASHISEHLPTVYWCCYFL